MMHVKHLYGLTLFPITLMTTTSIRARISLWLIILGVFSSVLPNGWLIMFSFCTDDVPFC